MGFLSLLWLLAEVAFWPLVLIALVAVGQLVALVLYDWLCRLDERHLERREQRERRPPVLPPNVIPIRPRKGAA
jgi:hypothetical protein